MVGGYPKEQTPPTHSSPAAHAAPFPHWHEPDAHVSVVPLQGGLLPHWQVPLAEHPFAAVVLHVVQVPPPVPQVGKDGAASHVVPLQHPLQDVALQTQPPPEHCWPEAQGPPVVPQTHVPVPEQRSLVVLLQELHVPPPVPQVG